MSCDKECWWANGEENILILNPSHEGERTCKEWCTDKEIKSKYPKGGETASMWQNSGKTWQDR